MSRAGTAERGFTLLELLVVLVILALCVGIAVPRVRTLLDPKIERTAQTVALALRDRRTVAMRTGRIVTVTADELRGGLPRGTELDGEGLGEAGLSFLPGGTSSGGSLVVAAADGRRTVVVDWLTGRVSVEGSPR